MLTGSLKVGAAEVQSLLKTNQNKAAQFLDKDHLLPDVESQASFFLGLQHSKSKFILINLDIQIKA